MHCFTANSGKSGAERKFLVISIWHGVMDD